MLVFLLSLFAVGLIAGGLARLIVPGRDPIGILGTALLGIVGSFIGGLLVSLLFENTLQLRTSGLIGSVIGAVIALLIYRSTYRRRVY
ncbi:MAG TPA: GlsB/YeaQ/YmgE family stress response membrane protein [Actinomycetota bacterium]|nr:GlsB/YeaQ/YmgE family stress response membrane protein [Actinomycetota bacterium]